MPGTRSSVAGHFELQLDGVPCGFLKAFDGGDISADVISEPTGPAAFVKKHVGPPKYEDFELQLGFDLAKPLWDWISAGWNLKPLRKSGAIVATDVNLTPVSERHFVDALITETTFPALDASSKEPAYLTVKLSPESAHSAKPTGTIGKVPVTKQKLFLASNFRVEIDGLDCSKVSKVDAFTIRQTLSADDIGESRIPSKNASALEFPNLKITLAEVGAKTWDEWFEDFVIKGNNADDGEKSGALVFLAPDSKAQLARITLHNVGIFALRRHRPVSNVEAIARVTAELYCEWMELHVGPVVPAIRRKPAVPVSPLRPVRPIR
jgi:hypothetical protein